MALRDQQGRVVDYLRVAVTDRCNLRCGYCAPPPDDRMPVGEPPLTDDELLRICRVLCAEGVRKVRATGGEPLLRPGLAHWLARVAALPSRPEVLVTTNGMLLADSVDALAHAGVRRINLSLDSLHPDTWSGITGGRGLGAVLAGLHAVVDRALALKINMVVLPGVNDHEILDFVGLARDLPITVRFIEPMPFFGARRDAFSPFDGGRILYAIRAEHALTPLPAASAAVDRLYAIDGHRGRVGVIEGHSRTFCRACSRLRIDPRGRLRTCLYGRPAADLGAIIRARGSDGDLVAAVQEALAARAADGHAAAGGRCTGFDSMASIGG